MVSVNKQWIEGYIFALSEEKYSYSVIQKRCEKHGMHVSKGKISYIVNNKGKNNPTLVSGRKKLPNKKSKEKKNSQCDKGTFFNFKRKFCNPMKCCKVYKMCTFNCK